MKIYLKQRRHLKLSGAIFVFVLTVPLHTVAGSEASLVTAESDDTEMQRNLGKSIYLKGIGEKGSPIVATTSGNVVLAGSQVACSNCHRDSGLGSSEGGTLIPAIAGTVLFQSTRSEQRELAGPAGPEAPVRDAYTKVSLAKAIQEGIDPHGRQLNPLMPRYMLDQNSLTALFAYLKNLRTQTAPGVSSREIRFATIVTDNTNPEIRQTMLSTLHAFVHSKNSATRNERRRAQNSPWTKEWHYQSYRSWVLDVWELQGPRETWSSQLQKFYKKQPVFAVVSGSADRNWQPVHNFCEQQRIPCLFPNTELPGSTGSGFYSFYFSKGIQLEAEVLASHLAGTHKHTETNQVLQVYTDNDNGTVATKAFRQALLDYNMTDIATLQLEAENDLTNQVRKLVSQKPNKPVSLVFWAPPPSEQTLNKLLETGSGVSEIYLSSQSANVDFFVLSERARKRLYLLYPADLPQMLERRLVRVHAWARIRKVISADERTLANTYFAATLLGDAIMHMRGNFSREYLLEKIEHIVDNSIFTSVYPQLSLGPGQRFASKGCYIVRPAKNRASGLELASKWIIP